jgi:hypothetical protein
MAAPALRVQDRRSDRIIPPTCATCAENNLMTVATRTEYVVYFRCELCGYVQSVRKPSWKPDDDHP